MSRSPVRVTVLSVMCRRWTAFLGARGVISLLAATTVSNDSEGFGVSLSSACCSSPDLRAASIARGPFVSRQSSEFLALCPR